MNTRPLIFALLAAGLGSADAATDWQNNRLIPLTKVTVGPWDNYEATPAPDGKAIYFTRAVNQIPNIYRQDPETNQASVFIGDQGDAKDPVLDATGAIMALTYFGRDAQGDICLVKPPQKELDCITDSQTVDESPFWIDANHLGFLSRRTGSLDWQIVSFDLAQKARKVLHQGLVSAPVASPDGRYVLFNQTVGDEPARTHVFDRQSGQLHTPARFDLSGTTGFMAFSRDGEYLYFNHYLSDTNGDQVIDGNDHSVTFRVPFQRWLNAKAPLLPEQLTSVGNNCKFPATTDNHLYLTCAFEGTLDVYRLPLTGSVPAQWNEQQLWEAHASARSHEQRLLILNTLRYRFKHDNVEMLERLLSNHLEIGELSAANYYVSQLQARYRDDPALSQFYRSLARLLEVRSAKQRVPVGLVTARFQKTVAEARTEMGTEKTWARLGALMEAYLDFELEDYDKAIARMRDVDLAAPMLPLERYLAFDIYRRLFEERDPQRLLAQYPFMFNADGLSLEARLYYAFEYLKLLAATEQSVEERMRTANGQADAASDARIAAVFLSEVASLQLASSDTPKEQGERFRALTELLKAHQKEPSVRKVLHTRAIQILGAAERFQHMELLSRHWLVTTHISEMEFFNVAEQYAVITMDKAYGTMAEGELAKAYSTFYSAIRQTDDLEAHYQFVRLGLMPSLNKRENLDRSFELLAKESLLGASRDYVAALRLVLEAEGDGKNAVKAWDQALALLNNMQAPKFNPAMRELLTGYLYHRKMRAASNGYRYDKTLFQKAHHHYMMAFDLARDNSRILASVWQNLGVLHFEAHNYALSAAFLGERMGIAFTAVDEEALARLTYARALFYSNEREAAKRQAEIAFGLARHSDALDALPFQEKVAFYAMQAADYALAGREYADLLGKGKDLSPANRTKALLAYGYALKQLGRKDEARRQLNALLAVSDGLSAAPRTDTRLVPFQPQRLQVLAYGLLAEMSDNAGERAGYRRQRAALLEKMTGRAEDFASEKAILLSLLAKDYQHIAVAHERAGDSQAMAEAMAQALNTATAWLKDTEDAAGPVIYRTVVNYLSVAISHPALFEKRQQKVLEETVRSMLGVFRDTPYRSPVTIAQQTKLEMLWEAYQAKVLHQAPDTLGQRLTAMLGSDEVAQLETASPDALKEISEIAQGLGSQ